MNAEIAAIKFLNICFRSDKMIAAKKFWTRMRPGNRTEIMTAYKTDPRQPIVIIRY